MTDIHTHVLPNVDDGSQSLDMSLEMLEMAASSGVDTLVMTPHCNIPDTYDNYADADLLRRFFEVERAAEREGIPVRLVRGMEVYSTDDMPELLERKKLLTLNGTRYLLMEFSFDEDPEFTDEVTKRVRALGFYPVIAHPERYYFVQEDPYIAFNWCVSGCALQVNKGSLLGRFGEGPERIAHELVRHNLAACCASDAHRSYLRTTDMREVSDLLEDIYGPEYARLLLKTNPDRILSGKSLYGFEPVPF